ncbi:hypothetical protein FA13DRAFT_1784904 [Coprinellus micaceus]|uniref:Uncharacterized protein n=1 Tax=Coprinellus micaceus TaxID=71717 RepID=A0A4Y7TX88_COPMI|nr:hypothetical protein FA13DRAFT_1784904 [Coprinellus micaceus]
MSLCPVDPIGRDPGIEPAGTPSVSTRETPDGVLLQYDHGEPESGSIHGSLRRTRDTSRSQSSFSHHNAPFLATTANPTWEGYTDAGPQGAETSMDIHQTKKLAVVVSTVVGGESAQDAAHEAVAEIQMRQAQGPPPPPFDPLAAIWNSGENPDEIAWMSGYLHAFFDPSQIPGTDVLIILLRTLMYNNRHRTDDMVPFSDITGMIELLYFRQRAALEAVGGDPAGTQGLAGPHAGTQESSLHTGSSVLTRAHFETMRLRAREVFTNAAESLSISDTPALPGVGTGGDGSGALTGSTPAASSGSGDGSSDGGSGGGGSGGGGSSGGGSSGGGSSGGCVSSSAQGSRMVDDCREFTRDGDGASGSGGSRTRGWEPVDREAFFANLLEENKPPESSDTEDGSE